VDRILRERADDVLDTDRAVRRVEAQRHRHIGGDGAAPNQARMPGVHACMRCCFLLCTFPP
jgi:hypothetical protein